jgi:photosystem II stability/assembly factor-like uncharacterized protein
VQISSPADLSTWVAISPAFASDRLVLAGTNNGIFRSADGGTNWQPIGRAEVGAGTVVPRVEFSPAYATDRTVFAVASGRGLMPITLDTAGAAGLHVLVGPNAGEQISAVALAIEMACEAGDIRFTMRPPMRSTTVC